MQHPACDLTAISRSDGHPNNCIIMPCKKPEYMLLQVCQPDDKQTTCKMLNGVQIDQSFAVLRNNSKTYQVEFLAHCLSCLRKSRCVIVQLWVSIMATISILSSIVVHVICQDISEVNVLTSV